MPMISQVFAAVRCRSPLRLRTRGAAVRFIDCNRGIRRIREVWLHSDIGLGCH